MRLIARAGAPICRGVLSLFVMIALSTATAPSGRAADETVLFQQPTLEGIAGNFHVPKAEHQIPKERSFNVLLWQPNPNQLDGELVPSHRSVADKTGFQPGQPLERHQAAFRDGDDETTVQIDGDTIGVFLNSKDLPNQSPGDKLMITPELRLPEGQRVNPFAQPGAAMVSSVELQIPVAVDEDHPGNFTYVTSDFTFEDRRTGTKISYGIHIFHHAPSARPPFPIDRLRKTEAGAYDEPSHSYQVGNPLSPASRVVSALSGSALFQDQPWTGWRSFRSAITQRNFQAALRALREKYPDFSGSSNPADYEFVAWHLNAELKFATGPAELGWSMRRASIALAPENRLNLSAQ